MNEPSFRDEASKEEILASIRQTVSEGAAEAGGREGGPSGDEGSTRDIGTGDPEILDLTREVREDGSVVDLTTGATVVEPGGSEQREGLVGAETETASAAAFAALAETVVERQSSSAAGGGKTIEDAVKEVMRPMIKDWLDAHLPDIVERLVQREIERMSRRGEISAGQ